MMTETTTTETAKLPEKRWYVIHTYSGYENKVKANLEHRIESMGMEDKIFQVLVPMEDEIEIRQGRGSVLFARPVRQGWAEVAGRVVLEEVRPYPAAVGDA